MPANKGVHISPSHVRFFVISHGSLDNAVRGVCGGRENESVTQRYLSYCRLNKSYKTMPVAATCACAAQYLKNAAQHGQKPQRFPRFFESCRLARDILSVYGGVSIKLLTMCYNRSIPVIERCVRTMALVLRPIKTFY